MMAAGDVASTPLAMTTSISQILQYLITRGAAIGVVLGPIAGLLIWLLPLGLEPAAHKACAIVAFMLVYWVTEPIAHGITALLGCFLFWALHATTFAVAFSGFTNPVPWFVFGALLMGQAASRTGLGKRLGYLIMQQVGTTYSRLLLGIITLTLMLQFLIPVPNAQIVMMAPLVIGLVAVFELGARSNIATGLFIILTYTSNLFSKMFLGSSHTILTRGIIEAQMGVQVQWGQWFIAFLPVTLLTVVACWVTIRWLYPPETPTISGGQQYLQESLKAMGPWSWGEWKALVWLSLAITLWTTDFLHQTHPAVIGIGIGLLLTLPKVGVLDTDTVKSVNFLLIIFLGGALSMGNVLEDTQALAIVTQRLMNWITPLLTEPFHAALTLYWSGFFYHFLMPGESPMVSTALPILLTVAETQGYNPVAMGMLWLFSSAGMLFVYQSSILVLGYSYGYFTGRDLLKVGAVVTLVEGLFLMTLPVYWPLIGLPWTTTTPP